MKTKNLKAAATGAASGILNGLFGGGGGLVLVPLLKRFVKIGVKQSHATAIAIASCMSVVTAVVYLAKGQVSLSDAWPFMAGGAVGGMAGGLLLGRINKTLLRRIFAVFLIVSAVRMFFGG